MLPKNNPFSNYRANCRNNCYKSIIGYAINNGIMLIAWHAKSNGKIEKHKANLESKIYSWIYNFKGHLRSSRNISFGWACPPHSVQNFPVAGSKISRQNNADYIFQINLYVLSLDISAIVP